MIWIPALILQVAAPDSAKEALPPLPPLHGGPAPMTCPVSGEAFSAWRAGSYSTYGSRPDGKPYSYLPFPFPLPECPTNKLIVFDDFTPVDVARLAPLIAGAAYRDLAATQTPYYRAFWLAKALGRPTDQWMWLLLNATWEVKGGAMSPPPTPVRSAQAKAYQREFARLAATLPSATPAKDRIWIEARAANALRELGDFRSAAAMRRRALATLVPLTDKQGWDEYLLKLDGVIARHDAGPEPLDMIPLQEAGLTCSKPVARRSAFEVAFCATPAMVAEAAKFRAVHGETR